MTIAMFGGVAQPYLVANLRPIVLDETCVSRLFERNRARVYVDVERLTNSFRPWLRFDIGIEEMKQKKKRNQRLEMKLKRMFALAGTKNERQKFHFAVFLTLRDRHKWNSKKGARRAEQQQYRR